MDKQIGIKLILQVMQAKSEVFFYYFISLNPQKS